MSETLNLNNWKDNIVLYKTHENVKKEVEERIKNGENTYHTRALLTFCESKKIDDELRSHLGREGYIMQQEEKVKLITKLVMDKENIHNILEIGFNAGHSSMLFLMNAPNAKVVSFDIGVNGYVDRAKKCIDNLYPNRHTLIKGNSLVTVPDYLSKNDTKFDIIFIDGGHEYNTAIMDLKNCYDGKKDDTLLIMDDIVAGNNPIMNHFNSGPTKAWEEYKNLKNIKELGNITLEKGHGLSWGKYETKIENEDEEILMKYKNRNKKQMMEAIVDLYHRKIMKDLRLLSDLYIDYFGFENNKDMRLAKFFNAIGYGSENKEKAISRFEELIDDPDLENDIKGWSFGHLGGLYGRKLKPIPKIIHLLYFGETELYNFQYKCVKSMIEHMPNYKIIIYNKKEPKNNKYWDLLMKERNVEVKKIEVPEYFDGYKLNHFQYKADVVRLEILYEYGGVYLDLDMLVVNNFDELFKSNKDFYISYEGDEKKGSGLINAFLAAKPKNEFVKIWLDNFKSGLRMNSWAYHIRDTNKYLLKKNPHYMIKYNIKLLDHKHFFPFLWQERNKFINIGKHKFEKDNYGVHLFETILKDCLVNNPYFMLENTEDEQYYHDFKNDKFLNEYIFKNKKKGKFIEIGACDGVFKSQGYYFEKEKDWEGLCIEPCKAYHKDLEKNRKRVLKMAVSDENGEKIFLEYGVPSLSLLEENEVLKRDQDNYKPKISSVYEVEVKTLLEILDSNRFDKEIDFCGIDAEGSEENIIRHYFENNSEYKIDCFAIEVGNNYKRIRDIFLKNDYIEIINPYLNEIRVDNNKKVTWEKYFIRNEKKGKIDGELIINKKVMDELPDEKIVLTLEETKDKYENTKMHFKSKKIGAKFMINNVHENPVTGCIESHINAIKYAKLKELDFVMIFEDDVEVRENINEIMMNDLPKEWDMLYFGGILTTMMKKEKDWVRGYIWCNHAYIVRKSMYDVILNKIAEFDLNELGREKKNIDWFYVSQIHPNYNCWLSESQPIIQRESYSVIDKKVKWGNNFDWSTYAMKHV